MSTLYIWEAANLFVGDEDPTKGKHLMLMNLKLPSFEEIYQEYHAGGSRVQIEVELGIKKFEPTFKLVGFDPDLLAAFGLGSKAKKIFTAYASIRDKRSGLVIEGKAIMEGRLGKIAPDEYKRGDLMGNALDEDDWIALREKALDFLPRRFREAAASLSRVPGA